MPYHVCTLKDKEEVKYLESFLSGVLQNCWSVSGMQIHVDFNFFHTYLLRWKTNFTLLIEREKDSGERKSNLRWLWSFFVEYAFFPPISKDDEKQYSYTVKFLHLLKLLEILSVLFLYTRDCDKLISFGSCELYWTCNLQRCSCHFSEKWRPNVFVLPN